MLKIVTVPNPILTKSVIKVEKFDRSLDELVKEMEETLIAQVNPQGVGLAAPQINENKALFIIKPAKKTKTETFVNARILQHKTFKTKKNKTKLEGCLSIPKIWGPVERAKKIYLEYQDLKGKLHKKWFSGFKAVVIQHEVDHLNGIMFSQRVLEQKGKLFEEKEGKLTKISDI